MIRLSKEQVILLHGNLIEATGGLSGIRDEGLLESALQSPFQSFESTEPYPSIYQKAARSGYGIIKNHPFIDGNKRSGTHVMLVFLALNGIELKYSQLELSEIILSVAAGETSFEKLTEWIIDHQI